MMKQSLPSILVALTLVLPGLPAAAESALAPEVSPPGDIPDSQAFVTYTSPFGYSIKVPEGWARKSEGATTSFSDKYNRLQLLEGETQQPLDEAYVKSSLVPELQRTGRAVEHLEVKKLPLKSGNSLVLVFDSNSEPNAVTNKQIREENERLYFVNDKRLVTVTLSAPKGADNIDQWQFMANSFRWK